MTPPLVSVVIPCFNGGAFLPAALASVEAQDYPAREVVVVDDGSDDPATLALLDGLGAGARLVRQPNRGLAAARNAGMAAAAGRYLLPLDCDDRIAPAFLSRTVEALERAPAAAFSFTHLALAGEASGILAKDYDFFTQLFLNQLPYCMLLRREAWQAAGGYDESMRDGYEDWEFNIRLGGRGLAGVCVPEPLFVYRVSGGGMLQAVSRRRHGELWRAVQRRNQTLYAPSALWSAWRRRGARRPYPAFLLVGLLGAHRVLPTPAFNALFTRLLRYSASARAMGGEG